MKSALQDKNFIEKAIDSFIRPFRLKYNENDLGPKKFEINNIEFKRQDFQLLNNRNLIMKCSYYTRHNHNSKIIIFLHGNSGSRLDGKILALPILINQFSNQTQQGFFTFDFCGCGVSEGDHITLGINQTRDLQIIYKYVNGILGYNQIYIWGRSMGAVTGLRFAQKFKEYKIQGVIADSPFKNLFQLSLQIIQQKIYLPKILFSPVVSMLFSTIKQRLNIDFYDCEVQTKLKQISVPTLLIASKEDTLVNYKHSQSIYQGIRQKKKMIYVVGDHNQIRKRQTIEEVLQFFRKPDIIDIQIRDRPLSHYATNKNNPYNVIKKRSISKHVDNSENYNFQKKSYSKLKSIPSIKSKKILIDGNNEVRRQFKRQVGMQMNNECNSEKQEQMYVNNFRQMYKKQKSEYKYRKSIDYNKGKLQQKKIKKMTTANSIPCLQQKQNIIRSFNEHKQTKWQYKQRKYVNETCLGQLNQVNKIQSKSKYLNERCLGQINQVNKINIGIDMHKQGQNKDMVRSFQFQNYMNGNESGINQIRYNRTYTSFIEPNQYKETIRQQISDRRGMYL